MVVLDLQGELPMKLIADGRMVERHQVHRWVVLKPMAMTKYSADDTEGESGSYRSASWDVLVCHVRIVLRFS